MISVATRALIALILAVAAGASSFAQPNPPAKPAASEAVPTPAQAAKQETDKKEAGKTEDEKTEPAFEISKPAEPPISLEASMSLRDPFRRPVLRAGDGKDEGGKVPELERYSVDEFKLVGVITGTRKNKAMLVTPDGKMHIVSESARIGLRHGVIKKIVPGKVDIEEKSVNILGEEEKSETTIELSEKGDDKEGRRL